MKFLFILLVFIGCTERPKIVDMERERRRTINNNFLHCSDRFMACYKRKKVFDDRFDSLRIVWQLYRASLDTKMMKITTAKMDEINEIKRGMLKEMERINDTCRWILHPEQKPKLYSDSCWVITNGSKRPCDIIEIYY